MSAQQTEAPLTLAYATSAVLTLAAIALLIWLCGYALDRLCGRYDDQATNLSGRARTRARSTSPDRPARSWETHR